MKTIRKPQVRVEPVFPEAKERHGLRRTRLWDRLNANTQGLLFVGRPAPEAPLGGHPLRPASCLVQEPPGPSGGAKVARGRLRVIADPTGDRGTTEPVLEWSMTGTPAIGGVFQRPEPLHDVAHPESARVTYH
jgi:hypothetical protein